MVSKPICRHCVAGVQLFKWYRNLSAGTVLQGCICLSGIETYLPAMCCRDAAVKAVSKPIFRHCAAGDAAVYAVLESPAGQCVARVQAV